MPEGNDADTETLRQHAPILLLALGLVSLPCVSAAQVLGTVAGTVRDVSGAVLPGVTVEASSPALIEKVRTAVTDGAGQYRIVNLPPGTYVMTFTLTGFSTVRREGVDVSINVTSNIDAELRVGDLKETITVSGEAPVVDLQSTAQTTVADSRTFKELPSGGSWVNIAQLVPAINSAFFGVRDVGGLQGDQTGTQVSVHGGIPGDGVSMIDGMRIGNMYLSSNLTNMSLSALIYDEVNISFSGQTPESGTNGVIMNAIPKSGGNEFHGSLLANGSAPSLQGSNVNDRLRARGASDTDSLKKLYDINGAIGGPIKRDKLWFYFTSRYFTNEYYQAGLYFAVDPSAFVRTPDLTRQAFAGTWTADNNIRLTWAPTAKQKVSGWYAYQRKDDPHWLSQLLFMSPEAAQLVRWPTQLSTITWTYTATNRLLIEAGIAPGESPDTITQPPGSIAGVPIFELGGPNVPFNFAHRASWFNDYDDRLPSQTFKGSVSYVTGSHSFKVGTQLQRGHFERRDTNHAQGDYYIISLDGSPLLATITSPLSGWVDRLNYNFGIYAQDSWTTKRLTLSGGVRLDFQNESVDAYHYGPGPWLPNRNVDRAEIKNVPNWKDVDPRINASLRPVRQREDGHQGEREPQRPPGLDWRRPSQRSGRQSPGDVYQPPVVRQQRQQDAGLRPVQSGAAEFLRARLRSHKGPVRTLGQREFRQSRPCHHLGLQDSQRVGRAAVQLGVLGRHPAGSDPAGLHQRGLLPPRAGELLGDRQRARERVRLYLLQRHGAHGPASPQLWAGHQRHPRSQPRQARSEP